MGLLDAVLEQLDRLVGLSSPPKNFTAPAKAASPRLTEIKNDEYRGREDLTEFTVPEGVVKIGSSAFRDCRNLESILLPSTLQYIGCNAFTGCKRLTRIVVPPRVNYIANGAFSDCSMLETAELPQMLPKINGGLFYNCKAIENVTMPRTIKGSFSNIFPHCESLKSFVIPYGADELGAFTFEYCYSLQSLAIPNTVRYIGHRSIMYCNSLREVYVPDSVEKIACLHTFYHCASLEKVRLPLGVIFCDILNDNTEDKAALCFADCPMLHTLEMCGREFHVDRLDDDAIAIVRAELAADGVQAAMKLVAEHLPRIIRALTDKERIDITEKLLSVLPQETVSPEALLAAIDYAADSGRHEIYLMLVKYKNGGTDIIDPASRFVL